MLSSDFPSVKLIDLSSVVDRGNPIPHAVLFTPQMLQEPALDPRNPAARAPGVHRRPRTESVATAWPFRAQEGGERRELVRLGLRVSETLSARGRVRVYFEITFSHLQNGDGILWWWRCVDMSPLGVRRTEPLLQGRPCPMEGT